jgi:type III secretion system FlhB-like substrate exporter
MANADASDAAAQVAVALKYDVGKDIAPRLTAKGKGDAAARLWKSRKGRGFTLSITSRWRDLCHSLNSTSRFPRSYSGRSPRWLDLFSKKPDKPIRACKPPLLRAAIGAFALRTLAGRRKA